jgi:hypothetical protein
VDGDAKQKEGAQRPGHWAPGAGKLGTKGTSVVLGAAAEGVVGWLARGGGVIGWGGVHVAACSGRSFPRPPDEEFDSTLYQHRRQIHIPPTDLAERISTLVTKPRLASYLNIEHRSFYISQH